MNKNQLAKLVLLEIQSLREGKFEGRTSDMLTLVNEILRDARLLALCTIRKRNKIKKL